MRCEDQIARFRLRRESTQETEVDYQINFYIFIG